MKKLPVFAKIQLSAQTRAASPECQLACVSAPLFCGPDERWSLIWSKRFALVWFSFHLCINWNGQKVGQKKEVESGCSITPDQDQNSHLFDAFHKTCDIYLGMIPGLCSGKFETIARTAFDNLTQFSLLLKWQMSKILFVRDSMFYRVAIISFVAVACRFFARRIGRVLLQRFTWFESYRKNVYVHVCKNEEHSHITAFFEITFCFSFEGVARLFGSINTKEAAVK